MGSNDLAMFGGLGGGHLPAPTGNRKVDRQMYLEADKMMASARLVAQHTAQQAALAGLAMQATRQVGLVRQMLTCEDDLTNAQLVDIQVTFGQGVQQTLMRYSNGY